MIDQLRPFYDTARALFPLLPQWYEETDACITPEFNHLNSGGLPVFCIPPGYTLLPDEGYHEAGHAYQKLLERADPTRDYLALYWSFRGFASTWQLALAGSVLESGTAGWQLDPRESWAEAFARGIAITHNEKTLTYGKDMDALALRAFFQSLTGPAAHPVPPVGGSALNVIPLPSPNFSARAREIRYIVLHTTQGTDSRSWLTNPASQVSAHYLVRGTEIYRLVDEDDAAWHAGIIVGVPTTPLYTLGTNPNDESIGIEMEGFAGQRLDDATIDSTVELIRDIETRRGYLPLVSHSELSPGNRTDPGAPNRAAVEERLAQEMFSDADKTWLTAQISASEARVLAAVKDYNPLIQVGRRIVRSLRGSNPPVRDPGTAYPDDTTPIK